MAMATIAHDLDNSLPPADRAGALLRWVVYALVIACVSERFQIGLLETDLVFKIYIQPLCTEESRQT